MFCHWIFSKKKCFSIIGGKRDTEDNWVAKVNYILYVFSEGSLIWHHLEERRKDNSQSWSLNKCIQLFILHIENSVGL